MALHGHCLTHCGLSTINRHRGIRTGDDHLPICLCNDRMPICCCNHCGVMAAWSRKTLTIFVKIVFFFVKKETCYGKIFKILFWRFIWRHRLTSLCSNFVKFGRRKIGEIVRCLPDQKQKQNFGCLSNCRYCADRAQNLPVSAPNNVRTMLQI